MFAKNDTAQLPFLEVKIYVCDLFLKIYIFSMNKWARSTRARNQEVLSKSVSWILSFIAINSC